jgi:DNA-binding Lrp family transcriptional regulator
MLELDRIDRKILDFLQEHGRASNLELAQAVGLSPAQSHRRHRRLEELERVMNFGVIFSKSPLCCGNEQKTISQRRE